MKVYFRHEDEDAPGALIADVDYTQLKDLYDTLRVNGIRDSSSGYIDTSTLATEFVYQPDPRKFYFEITYSDG